MKKYYRYIFLLLFVFSCKNKYVKTYTKDKIKIEKNVDTNYKDMHPKNDPIKKNINIKKIKSDADYVTTTFLSRKETKDFLFKDKRYYLFIHLIKQDKKKLKKVGHLITYDSINPYTFDKDTDIFVELFLKKAGIPIYEGKIKIGMNIDSLKNFFGNRYDSIENFIIYKYGEQRLFFKIKDNKVTKIKIGIYKKNIKDYDLIKDL